MDANCSKVFTTLIQMHDFYPKTEEGYFECAYKVLGMACGLSQNLVKAALAGLFLEGLIDVVSVGKGRGKHTNKYKVNVEKFKEYESTPVGIAIMTEDKPIHQANYKGTRFMLPWDMYKSEYEVAQENAQGTAQSIAQGTAQKVTTNITNIPNTDNINNKDNKEDNMRIVPVEERDSFYDDSQRNLVMVIEEKKPCSIEELRDIYTRHFIEILNSYPSLNYSLLRTCQDNTFYECYQDIVNELLMRTRQETQRDIKVEELLGSFNNYLEYIGYSQQ